MEQKKIACKAVLFDLWDTLVQSRGITRQTQQKMGLSGMPFSDFIRRFEKAFMLKEFSSLSEGFSSVFKEFGIKHDEFLVADLEKLWNSQIETAVLFPETIAVLNSLKAKGFRLGVVSNCQWFRTRELLRRLGLSEILDGVSLSFEVGFLKPHPRLFEDCLHQLNVFASDAVMVGDSDTDIYGAIASGLKGVFLDRSTFKEQPQGAKAKISTLKELPVILEFGSDDGW